MKLETMLGYDWGNSSSIMLSAEEPAAPHVSESNRPVFDLYYQTTNFNPDNSFTTPHHHHHFPVHHPINPITSAHLTNFHVPHPYPTYPHSRAPPLPFGLEPYGPDGLTVVLKREPVVDGRFDGELNSRIGLNLGGRTYFASSSENDFMNRVYLRSKMPEPGSVNFPRCQAEGCVADLTAAKQYHRRHKVCEFHSKAAAVVAAGLTQRFCQQCSSEFDNGKRSCRRRLADHNRRRRKSHQSNHEGSKSPLHHNNGKDSSSGQNLTSSLPYDSEPHSSSSTVVAISPPRISLDCFGNRSYAGGAATFYFGSQSN